MLNKGIADKQISSSVETIQTVCTSYTRRSGWKSNCYNWCSRCAHFDCTSLKVSAFTHNALQWVVMECLTIINCWSRCRSCTELNWLTCFTRIISSVGDGRSLDRSKGDSCIVWAVLSKQLQTAVSEIPLPLLELMNLCVNPVVNTLRIDFVLLHKTPSSRQYFGLTWIPIEFQIFFSSNGRSLCDTNYFIRSPRLPKQHYAILWIETETQQRTCHQSVDEQVFHSFPSCFP